MKKLIAAAALISATQVFAQNIDAADPLYIKQWALKNNGQVVLRYISDLERIKVQGLPGQDINWVDTSLLPATKKELIVAVLDSGLDIEHPDLKGRIWYNEKCTNAPNAKILPCNGYNYLEMNNNLTDDIGHGTHVAGVIAANRNSIGIAGAADPRIKIMPLKVLNSDVSGFVFNGKLITDVIADAMIFAIKNGAEVVNLSLGWPKLIDTPKVRQAFQMAEDQNVMVIAASGNNNKDLPTFPCAYENVVCVGAIDNRGELTDFSNHGAKVDMVAPGEYIVSTYPKKLESRVLRIANYEVKRGSSQAAPYVTAAVATLKLLRPGLTNDAVRALLFKTSRSLTNQSNKKFIKFGALDMKKMLASVDAAEEAAFVNPQIKAITEIKFRIEDKRFKFNLPVKNLSGIDFNGDLCISHNSSAIRFDQECYEIKNLAGKNTVNIPVQGSIDDLASDSHINIKIHVNKDNFFSTLVFSRDLNGDNQIVSERIAGANFDDMAIINGDRKLSRMARVTDKFRRLNFPEYFYIEKAKQTPNATVVSLLTKEQGEYVVKPIFLPLVNRVLSIHRQDINLDGELDTFIYALSAKKDELIFFNLDRNLKPLFGKYSTWVMALSTFEGLPIEAGNEKFEWIKLHHEQLGAIVVPSVFKSYAMPEADNSKVVLERITYASNHHFYLNPKIQKESDGMKIELRVLDSVAAMKKMRTDFKLYADQSINLLRPMPQTNEQSLRGEIHSLAALDNGNGLQFIEIVFDGKSIKTNYLSDIIGLESALIYPVMNTFNGAITDKTVLTSLLNRSQAEFLFKTEFSITGPMILKQDWENPVIGLIGAFESPQGTAIIVENRSTVTLLTKDRKKMDLPVYRDSAFPGQNFSESLMPVLSQGRPGVYINSTLIYGERLYSMIDTKKGFIRPMNLSISFPNGCVPLNPETLTEKTTFNYVFLCTDPSKQVALKFLPMSEL